VLLDREVNRFSAKKALFWAKKPLKINDLADANKINDLASP
jgi:hypothetical protein